MRGVLGLALLVTAPLSGHAQASDVAFAPDTVPQIPGGPRVVVLHADPAGGGMPGRCPRLRHPNAVGLGI
jgi:hypothetical protein